MSDNETCVFGKAVNEFRAKLETMTASLVAACNPSPTLAITVRGMLCDAAVQAIGEFAKDTNCIGDLGGRHDRRAEAAPRQTDGRLQ